jgi:hypothetical protein
MLKESAPKKAKKKKTLLRRDKIDARIVAHLHSYMDLDVDQSYKNRVVKKQKVHTLPTTLRTFMRASASKVACGIRRAWPRAWSLATRSTLGDPQMTTKQRRTPRALSIESQVTIRRRR